MEVKQLKDTSLGTNSIPSSLKQLGRRQHAANALLPAFKQSRFHKLIKYTFEGKSPNKANPHSMILAVSSPGRNTCLSFTFLWLAYWSTGAAFRSVDSYVVIRIAMALCPAWELLEPTVSPRQSGRWVPTHSLFAGFPFKIK